MEGPRGQLAGTPARGPQADEGEGPVTWEGNGESGARKDTGQMYTWRRAQPPGQMLMGGLGSDRYIGQHKVIDDPDKRSFSGVMGVKFPSRGS